MGDYRESDSSEEEESRVIPLPPLQGRRKSVRLREPPAITRRLARFPSLQRRESIISSYRSGLYDPKVVTFVKNGDKHFEGVKINVSQRNFRSLDVLLSELSRCIELPAGVRNIYTPQGGHRVTNLSQFEHKKTYVCASTEPFKRMDYGNLKNPNWQPTTKLKHLPLSNSVFGKNFNMNASLNASIRSLDASTKGQKTLFTVSKPAARQKQMRMSPILTEVDEEVPESGSLSTSQTLSPKVVKEPKLLSAAAKPVAITIICNGPPPRQCVTVLLSTSTVTSWEHVRRLISENLKTINGCLRLFRLDGEEVQSLSQLWKAGSTLIAVGNEKFDFEEFLQAPLAQTCQQVNPGDKVAAVEHNLPPFQENSKPTEMKKMDKVDSHDQQITPVRCTQEAQARSDSHKADLHRQPQDYNHNIASEAVSYRGQKQLQPDVSSTPLSEPHFPPTPFPTMPSASLEDALRKLPVDNHYLFGLDRPSTGSASSESSISMLPRVSSSRVYPAPLIHPQTPQSGISLGVMQSVVDMILPKAVDVLSSGVSTFSSESMHSAKRKPGRNIGIQTNFIDNHLSTVFEAEEEPPEPHPSAKFLSRDKTTGMQRQNSSASQTDINTEFEASCNARHSKKKEKYTVGMLIAEGNYAVVKQCKEKASNRRFVLRVINKAKVFMREDLINIELKIMKSLRHENILQVVDNWETSDEFCLILEQIEGGDLFDAILHCQHFCEQDAVRVMQQLGVALVYLHAHRIVHREIKPENIFLTSSNSSWNGGWKLKLGGFSLANFVTEPLSLVCGTPYYMAPEMLMETGYGTKIDVWSAGVICYILLSGIMPFRRKSNTDMLANIMSGQFSFPSPFWDHVSEEAKDFIRHLLIVAPQKRYSSSQMLQHSWLRERSHWEESEESAQLSRCLTDHLNSKAATNNATISILTVTALDKRRGIVRPHNQKHTSNKH